MKIRREAQTICMEEPDNQNMDIAVSVDREDTNPTIAISSGNKLTDLYLGLDL